MADSRKYTFHSDAVECPSNLANCSSFPLTVKLNVQRTASGNAEGADASKPAGENKTNLSVTTTRTINPGLNLE